MDIHGGERARLMNGIEPSDVELMGQKRPAIVMLEEMLQRGQKSGQITTQYSVEKLSELYLVAVRGVAADWARHMGRYSILERMEQFMGLFIQSLLSK
jgi:hypothetical protein